MADGLTTQSSTLATVPASSKIATDDAGAAGHVQVVKLAVSTDGSATALTADADGMLVNLGANNDVTVTGTVMANLSATDNAVLDVIEVNTSYGDNTGGGVEAGALRVTLASDSTGLVSVDDNGGSLTVDNAALAVTGGGVEATALRVTLASDSTGVLSVDDNGGSLTIDNAALAVTGGGVEASALRVTLASDSTGVLSVDDGGGSLTVDGTVTANLSATDNAVLDAIAASVAGTLTVGSHAVTNAGTFATQATLQANSGVDIGDVDVTSVIPGTGATNLGKAIDTAAGATDTGIAALAVRDDSLTTLTPIDGDYVPLRVNSTGALHVTGAGGGTQYNVDDASPTVVTMAGVVRDDTLTTLTEIDGDATVLRVSSTGALHVTGGGGGTEYTDDTSTHASGSTVGNAMMAAATPTDGAVDANDMGVVAMSLDRRLLVDAQIAGQDADITIADGGNSITVDNAALSVTGGGVEASALRVTLANDSTGVLSVDDNGGSLTVDGTVAISGTVTVDGSGVTQPVSNTNIDNLHSADFDTGAGTDTTSAIGIAVAASGGAAVITGDVTNGLDVDVTRISGTVTVDGSGVTQPVSGTVTANAGTGPWPVTDNGGALTVDWAGTAPPIGAGVEATALRVTVATDSTGVLSVDDNGGSLTVDNAALSVTGGGVEASALRVTLASDSTGVLSVDDNGGSLTIDGTVTASNAAGDIAHDAADSGNPVKVGFKAYNMDGTAPGTAVAEADRANGISDVYGRQYVETAHPNLWQAMGLYTTAQTDASVKAAPGAGLSLYITDIVVSTDTAFNCFFEQGTTKVYGTLYLAANGGASSHFVTPIKLPANTALTFTSSATANHSVTVNGYTAE